MIRVILPGHLRTLARITGEVKLEVEGAVTQRSVLDALEARYPMLRGTIRDHVTKERRPMLRFFACEEDLSHEDPDAPLPDAVVSGKEPFWVVGAVAGGLAAVAKRTSVGADIPVCPNQGGQECLTHGVWLRFQSRPFPEGRRDRCSRNRRKNTSGYRGSSASGPTKPRRRWSRASRPRNSRERSECARSAACGWCARGRAR